MTEHPLYAAGAIESPGRRALIQAALREVALAGTTAVSLSHISRSAGQSRRFARYEFADADSLIIESAVLTARDALVAGESNAFSSPFEHFEILATALMDHFGKYRLFYRAVLSGPLASRANKQLDELVRPMNQLMVDQVSGPESAAADRAQTAEFFTARSRQIVGKWLTDPDSADTAEDITPRLRRIVETLRSEAAPPSPRSPDSA